MKVFGNTLLFLERGVRDVGYETADGKFVEIPEMIPEIVVPDLTDFKVGFSNASVLLIFIYG